MGFAQRPLRRFALGWLLGVTGPSMTEAAGPVAKWLGQDGKDFVGGEPGPSPNGYQDVHVALSGMPSGRGLVEVEFHGHGHGAWSNQVKNKAAVHLVRGRSRGASSFTSNPTSARWAASFR